jgi:antitoxin YefM
MAMKEWPVADAPDPLSEFVANVEKTHARVTITKHGHPAAVLISPEDLASMEETRDVLSDPQALAAIREAEAEAARGEFIAAEEMTRLMEERQRRKTGAA